MAFEQDYIDAMKEHGNKRVELDLTVLSLSCMISTLQLALRHPRFPARIRPQVESFIAEAIEPMRGLSPAIADVWERGNADA